MKYIRKFTEHSVYEENKNELVYPSVSYCVKENEVHYGSNLGNIRFYVGDLSGKTDQVVTINYSGGTSDTVSIPEGNKWYTHNIPNEKTLSSVTKLDYIKEAIVNCDKAYFQPWDNVDKVSYINCKFLGGNAFISKFTSLDVRTVDTSNVTNMKDMFNYSTGLTSLDVSSFNTNKVTDMGGMFASCNGLTSLDVSNFNTSNVTDMKYMFYGCSGLTSLDVSNFNTSNVTYMTAMFNRCTSLESLDLSGWDVSNVSDMMYMFIRCSKLKTIRMVGCNSTTVNIIKNKLKEAEIQDQVTIIT